MQHDCIHHRRRQKREILLCPGFGSPAGSGRHTLLHCHVADREGLGFETVEQGTHILDCLRKCRTEATFLLDSTTALLMNELFLPPDWQLDEAAGERCGDEVAAFAQAVKHIVIVSDYIYSDAQRYDSVTETYRRGLASIDRKLAAISDVVLEMSGGNLIVHKGVLPE